MGRPDLLVSGRRAVSWRQRLAMGSPVTGQPVLPAGIRQDKGVKEPR
jgi:hypothetical protein